MTFQYMWLKILEVLARGPRTMTTEELRAELARRGFSVSDRELADSLSKLQEQGLVETLMLADGSPDLLASVAITARGERKIRSIVRL